MHKVKKNQKHTKRTKAKEPGLQQQKHKSQFLEALLVPLAEGKLKT